MLKKKSLKSHVASPWLNAGLILFSSVKERSYSSESSRGCIYYRDQQHGVESTKLCATLITHTKKKAFLKKGQIFRVRSVVPLH